MPVEVERTLLAIGVGRLRRQLLRFLVFVTTPLPRAVYVTTHCPLTSVCDGDTSALQTGSRHALYPPYLRPLPTLYPPLSPLSSHPLPAPNPILFSPSPAPFSALSRPLPAISPPLPLSPSLSIPVDLSPSHHITPHLPLPPPPPPSPSPLSAFLTPLLLLSISSFYHLPLSLSALHPSAPLPLSPLPSHPLSRPLTS